MELNKSLHADRWNLSLNDQWITGFSEQTLETSAIDSAAATERGVGIPAASYATLGASYNFNR